MPEFAYIARDQKGLKVTGVVSAASSPEAVTILSAKELFPIEVTQAKSAAGSVFGGKRVGGQVMATTYAQLASLLRSGVPILRSIAVLREQTKKPILAEVLDDVHSRVQDGEALGDAMGRYPKVFSEMAVSMVRAGSEGGFLEDALERVSQFTEQQEDLKSRTIGALAYPVFLAVIGTSVVTALIVFFVPQFASMFDRLREQGELPVLTDVLLWFSATVRSYGLPVLVAVIVGLFFLNRSFSTEAGMYWRDMMKLRVPLAGGIFQNLAVARFCRVLGTLLRNGVNILKALEISRAAAGNRVLSKAIEDASENISSGQALATPLAACEQFPGTVVEMIAVAEESNSLDRVLVDIADGLERRTGRRLDLLVRLIEPVMLLIMAGIVLFVVVALLLPVIKMSGTI